ncbi:alpha/beta hydrolase [Millisia brevis]|uniref:alpha/beta hydrolase n=1 Tax=Millisia brevis TaxID=264148 RepID=UPI00082D1527|nr:alpha/beta hydrolase family protein [Millisia brevis]
MVTALGFLRRTAAVATAALLLTAGVGVTSAEAQESARVVGIRAITDRMSEIDVYSPALGRTVTNTVLRPTGGPAPTYYLLNGVQGGVDGVSWRNSSSYARFFADKQVNVVTPLGGQFSNYTDWDHPDPVIGQPRWETYLVHELPPVIDAALGTTGRNAIGGVSMSAGPAITLAARFPGRYAAAASYSGCPVASGPLGTAQITAVTVSGGANAFNMWGPPGDPRWAAHDPMVLAGNLAGTAIHLASASGVPGPIDRVPPEFLVPVAVGGGTVEAASDLCTATFAQRLTDLGIAHRYDRYPTGAHTWNLFDRELADSWATIGPALGA